jgi:CBS domain-containing protein
MKVKDVMTKDVVICERDTIIKDIGIIMKKCDIGFIPISDDKEIVGVITDRDIVVRNAGDDDEVGSYITPRIITINSEATLEDAAALMGQEQVKRLLVREDDKPLGITSKPVGIISLSDLINHCDNNIIIDNLKRIWTIARNTDEYHTDINDFRL